MDVAFFHFPGLGTKWNVEGLSKTCDVESLETFVREFIRAWIASRVPDMKKTMRPR
jgi:hypothetical protein